MYIVYQHIFPNGKRYVGVTRTSVEKRWGYKGHNYKTQVVGRAIEKYGWDNIEHDIFCVCKTKEQAERVERFLVSHFDTTNPEHGYNVLPGGDVAVNDATPEMRYKLGNGSRGRTRTEEEKRKISDGCKRAFNRPESNGHIGKRASEETKKRMRDAHKDMAKSVDCFTKDGKFVARFRTVNDAAEWASGKKNLGTTAISRCCRRVPKYNSAFGFIWRYTEL